MTEEQAVRLVAVGTLWESSQTDRGSHDGLCAQSRALSTVSWGADVKSGGRWSLGRGGEGSDVKDTGSAHPCIQHPGCPCWNWGNQPGKVLGDVPPAWPSDCPPLVFSVVRFLRAPPLHLWVPETWPLRCPHVPWAYCETVCPLPSRCVSTQACGAQRERSSALYSQQLSCR